MGTILKDLVSWASAPAWAARWGEQIPTILLAFAGGGGGQALSLDANLLWGHTEHCETFDNPPLCQENFKVQLLEVWGFQNT